MAMMASASSRSPYDNYDNTEIEQDLIDPDDGISTCQTITLCTEVDVSSEQQQLR